MFLPLTEVKLMNICNSLSLFNLPAVFLCLSLSHTHFLYLWTAVTFRQYTRMCLPEWETATKNICWGHYFLFFSLHNSGCLIKWCSQHWIIAHSFNLLCWRPYSNSFWTTCLLCRQLRSHFHEQQSAHITWQLLRNVKSSPFSWKAGKRPTPLCVVHSTWCPFLGMETLQLNISSE